MLCRALGGKVGRAYGGWDIGLRKVSMVEDLPPYSFFDGLKEIPPCLTLIECHQDEVQSFVLALLSSTSLSLCLSLWVGGIIHKCYLIFLGCLDFLLGGDISSPCWHSIFVVAKNELKISLPLQYSGLRIMRQ